MEKEEKERGVGREFVKPCFLFIYKYVPVNRLIKNYQYTNCKTIIHHEKLSTAQLKKAMILLRENIISEAEREKVLNFKNIKKK